MASKEDVGKGSKLDVQKGSSTNQVNYFVIESVLLYIFSSFSDSLTCSFI